MKRNTTIVPIPTDCTHLEVPEGKTLEYSYGSRSGITAARIKRTPLHWRWRWLRRLVLGAV
jgi:hypothetical protein